MTVLLFSLVALVVLGLLVLVHRWVWVRLVRDTTAPGGWTRRVLTGCVFALPVLSVAALVAGRAGAPFWVQRVVAWPGFMWLAVLLYLALALLLAEPLRLLLRRSPAPASASASVPAPASGGEAGSVPLASVPASAGASPAGGVGIASSADGAGPASGGAAPADEAASPAPPEPSTAGQGATRRVFVARVLAGAAVAAAGGTVGYGTYGVLRGPRVKRVTVPLAKLPRPAHGFRIAVVSDVHLGPILGRAHTTRIVDTVNATQPDLIAIVGDLVDGSVHDLGSAAEPLARLRARHGSFFVTGNHEYFSGAQQWVDHVRELGVHPLENARQELPYFDLAGVNDVAGESEGHGPDFDKALGGRDRAHRTAVLLAHQPIVIHDAVRHGVDLQLSGHTHGGQLWPGNYLAELANPTVAGLERYGDTQLYVSRGAGAWGPPVRVGAPSDITVVELVSYQT
ncbi:metallophosphoesterase [Streptomyces sp. G-G2]|uniref:metallophosphoesterase n=1 Tax=Streptomyces sp. G-G2 TaxID=3046201 RepID=UPI0024B9D881|nr:metallophosphoesterase [Streptomyces sp. G-G2]MDJ0382843.1 metallophosphoesterase [Streptomyces sp. G-G2]